MKFLRDALQVLLENWALKLTAIFLALMLWIVVRGDPGAERVVTIPLEVGIPSNMEIVNDRPNAVDVTLEGFWSNMWLVQQMACNVDLRTAGEGEHIVPLTPENINLPHTAGLTVVGIRPARIVVDLERTVSRQLPVSVATSGDPARGYEVYAKRANPPVVLVSGPRSHVDYIREVSTQSVPLSDQTSPVRTYVNLNIPDALVHTTPFGPIRVDIEIGIHRKTVTLRNVPVVADEPGVTVRPSRVTVQLLVPANYEKQITPGDLSATVAVTGLDESQPEEKVSPQVKFTNPAGSAVIIIKDVQPPEVTIKRMRKS
jgi:YbbR domain-containing protein